MKKQQIVQLIIITLLCVNSEGTQSNKKATLKKLVKLHLTEQKLHSAGDVVQRGHLKHKHHEKSEPPSHAGKQMEMEARVLGWETSI